jgi:hypothetical protein
MENWKAIEEFPAYEVSDMGRVRRALPGLNTEVGRILRLNLMASGYLYVNMQKDGREYGRRVNRLVAKAFVPNPLNLPEVNHTGRKTNNRATMLEWRSRKGHVLDMMRRGQTGDGVNFHTRDKVWYAWYALEPYKRKYIGGYTTKKAALKARKEAVDALPYIL